VRNLAHGGTERLPSLRATADDKQRESADDAKGRPKNRACVHPCAVSFVRLPRLCLIDGFRILPISEKRVNPRKSSRPK
jgi:hypothetical protein